VQPEPTWGWASPTYTVKQPALSVIASVEGQLPLRIMSDWTFSPAKE
jgi:hypothetical protein